MNKTVKWILIGAGILVFLLLVFLLIRWVMQQAPSAPPAPYPPSTGPSSSPCVPFTQNQYDSAVKQCNAKCLKNLSVPVVGAGLYAQCLAKCKSQINNGYGVVMC